MSSHVRVLDGTSWDDEVLGAAGPVVVDFWAGWCAPCRVLAPIVEEVAEAHAGRVVFGKLDVDQEPELAARYGVQSIPTLIVFRNGQPVDRRLGAAPREEIARFVAAHLEDAGAAGTP